MLWLLNKIYNFVPALFVNKPKNLMETIIAFSSTNGEYKNCLYTKKRPALNLIHTYNAKMYAVSGSFCFPSINFPVCGAYTLLITSFISATLIAG